MLRQLPRIFEEFRLPGRRPAWFVRPSPVAELAIGPSEPSEPSVLQKFPLLRQPQPSPLLVSSTPPQAYSGRQRRDDVRVQHKLRLAPLEVNLRAAVAADEHARARLHSLHALAHRQDLAGEEACARSGARRQQDAASRLLLLGVRQEEKPLSDRLAPVQHEVVCARAQSSADERAPRRTCGGCGAWRR